MRIAFDSRPASDPRGIGRYVRCLLDALRETSNGHELVEASNPRGADVFHTPWIDGVRVRSACPQVVTDGVDGVLVPPGRPDALAAGVLRALEHRDELGAQARATARRFDADGYARRVEALIAP